MTIPPQPGPAPPEHDLNLLAAYAERRLESAEEARVVSHLVACGLCRETLATMAQGLRLERHREPGRAHLRAPTIAIAAGLALVVGAWIFLRRTAPDSKAGPASAPTASSPLRGPAGPPGGSLHAPPGAVLPGTAPPAADTSQPRSSRLPDETLLAKRGGPTKIVAGRTFKLGVDGWVDAAYDPAAALPTVDAKSPAERKALLERLPALVPYAALGERVIVVWEGRVYRLGPPSR